MSYEIYRRGDPEENYVPPSKTIPKVTDPRPRGSAKSHTTNGHPPLSTRATVDLTLIEHFTAESSAVQRNAMKVIKREFRALQLDPTISKLDVFDLLEVCEQLYESLKHTNVAATTKVQNYIRGYLIFGYFINNSIMAKFGGFQTFMKKSEYDFLIYINLFNFFDSDPNLEMKQLRLYIEEFLEKGSYLDFDMNILIEWLHSYLRYLKEKDAYDAEKDSDSAEDVYDMSEVKRNLDADTYSRQRVELDEDTEESSEESSDEDPAGAYEVGKVDTHSTFEADRMSLTSFKEKFPAMKGSATGSSDNSLSLKRPMLNGFRGNSLTNTNRKPPPSIEESNHKSPPPPPSSSSSPPYSNQALSTSRHSYTQQGNEVPSAERPGVLPTNGLPQSWSYSHSSISHRPSPMIPGGPQHFPAHSSSSVHSHPMPQSNGSYNHTNGIPQSNGSYSHSSMHNGSGFSQNPIPHPQTMPNLSPLPPLPGPEAWHQYPNPNQYQQNYYPQPLPLGPPQNMYPLQMGYSNQYNVNPVDHLKQDKLAYMKVNAICGLKNFGSSCYINLTLQLLFALIQFKSIFINLRYHKYIRDPKYVEQFNLNSTEPVLLSVAVSGLLKSFINHGSCGIAPSKFLRICAQLKPDFNIPNEQQDAQEFLLFLLERLHDELSIKNLREELVNSIVYKSEANVNTKDKEEYVKWYRALIDREGVSPVNDLFQGHLQNKLICNQCGYESVTYSPFTTLSLTIPQPSVAGGGNRDGSVDLSDCLKYFIKDEILTGDNAWKCPKCSERNNHSNTPSTGAVNALDDHPVFQQKKGIFSRKKSPVRKSNEKDAKALSKALQNTISIKRLSFVKLPQILLIHLSRFSMFNLKDKLNTAVKYPLQLKFNDPKSNDGAKIHYKLTALINHYGNLKSGHYTSLANKSTYHQQQSTDTNSVPNNIDNLLRPYWCYFDDDLVDSAVKHGNINPEQGSIVGDLNSSDVYVLCYEKCN